MSPSRWSSTPRHALPKPRRRGVGLNAQMARFGLFHQKFPSKSKPTQPKLKINHKTHLIPTNNTSKHQFHTIPYTFSILVFHTNLYKSIQIHIVVSIPGFLNFSSSFFFLLLLLFLSSSLLLFLSSFSFPSLH